jgi:hypothetical protein
MRQFLLLLRPSLRLERPRRRLRLVALPYRLNQRRRRLYFQRRSASCRLALALAKGRSGGSERRRGAEGEASWAVAALRGLVC